MQPGSGVVVDNYVILKSIGKGGMGEVFLARESPLERLVAIKFLLAAPDDDQYFRVRFEREAKIVASLDHPNIIPLYRYGITQGKPWMALRYVNGGDLSTKLATSGTEISAHLQTFIDIAGALDYAHKRGVVHRDLKPSNILVDEEGESYIADFGIAKLVEGKNLSITAEGAAIGTAEYMAPEQAQGLAVGPYTDVYALAVICFHWLSGRLPFQAKTPRETMLKHLVEPIPSYLLQHLREAVIPVMEKGLAKDSADRWQSAGLFVHELDLALNFSNTRSANKNPSTLHRTAAESFSSSAKSEGTSSPKPRNYRVLVGFIAVCVIVFGTAFLNYEQQSNYKHEVSNTDWPDRILTKKETSLGDNSNSNGKKSTLVVTASALPADRLAEPMLTPKADAEAQSKPRTYELRSLPVADQNDSIFGSMMQSASESGQFSPVVISRASRAMRGVMEKTIKAFNGDMAWVQLSEPATTRDTPSSSAYLRAKQLNKNGLSALTQNDFSGADGLFLEAARLNPDDVEILNNVGYTKFRLSKYSDGLVPLLAAIDLSPKRVTAWSNLADILGAMDEQQQAIGAFLITYESSAHKTVTLKSIQDRATNQGVPSLARAAQASLIRVEQ